MTERIIGFLLIAAFAVSSYLTYDQSQQTKDAAETTRRNLVAACERQNAFRQALYNNTLHDAQTREAAASGFSGPEGEIVAKFAQKGYDDLQAIIDASAEVAATPGSVVQDCEAAYPQ